MNLPRCRNPAVTPDPLPHAPPLLLSLSVSRKVRSSPPTKCPAECRPSPSLGTTATLSPQETDTSSSGTWTPPKNAGYRPDLQSANHSSFCSSLELTGCFIFSLYPGEQHGASDWSVGLARRPQEQCVQRGCVWAWPHGVQHLLHHQLRPAVSVQQQPTAGGLGQPQGQGGTRDIPPVQKETPAR